LANRDDDSGRGRATELDFVAKRRRLPFFQRLYAAAMGYLGRRLGLKLLLVYHRPLITEIAVPADVLATYCFKEIKATELLDETKDPALRLSTEFIAGAKARDDVCIGAFHGDRLVAYRWYAVSGTAPCDDPLYIRNTGHRQTYGYKMFTHPQHRGRRLQLYTMIYGDAQMLRRGFTHATLYVATHNFASRRGLSRVPSQRLVGLVACVRLFGRYFIASSPGLERYGFELAERIDADSLSPRVAQSWD
jgi:hypothetical protein